MCVHFLWVHILCCFINSASNAPLDKAREHGAGRRPLVQLLLLWVLGLRLQLYEGAVQQSSDGRMEANRGGNNVGYLIGRYSCYVSTAVFVFVTFDRQSDADEYQIYAIK